MRVLGHPHQHPILPHGYCHGWLCWARPPALMCRHDMFYLKIFQRDGQIKESAGFNRKHSVTREIFESQKWCSKSWACSAISSNSFLTPSWCQKGINCGKAIIPECLCSHFLRERNSSAFMAGCSNTESWWNAHFWEDDRLGPCKHISLMSPSPIFAARLCTRVGEQPWHVKSRIENVTRKHYGTDALCQNPGL